MEIRIYYESLEQALYYIKPALEENLKAQLVKEYEIKLIEKVQQNYSLDGKYSKKYSKSITNILINKNPDIIVSIIKNNIEIPILILEFSTAVFTKDHELQRTDNFNIAYSSKAIYVKVSPNKKTTGKHGGDTKYNYIQPYAMYYKNTNEIPFHIDWEVNKDDSSILIKHNNFKSLPNSMDEIKHLFSLILKSYIINLKKDNWKEGFNDIVKNNKKYSTWLNKLISYNEYENIKMLKSKRTKWFDYSSKIDRNNVFVIKFNRYTHSMDPERGMLSYYGTFCRNNTNVFVSELYCNPLKDQWYKCKSVNKMNAITSLISGNNISIENMIKILFLSLSLPDYDYFNEYKKVKNNIYDITKYVTKYFLNFNISFRNIINNSDFLRLYDGRTNEVFLTWNMDMVSNYLLDSCPNITEIKERERISEDDITFITVHSFFKKNNINIFSVSYPGAQSDTPILPNKYTGRTQDRTYIDAIGLKDDFLILQENKGPFKVSEINDDLSKMKRFRIETNYINAVNDFKDRYSIQSKTLILGVGFGMNSKTQISDIYSKTTIEDVDYFLIISKDKTTWKVFSSIDNDSLLFQIKSDKIDSIKTYGVL